MHDAFLAAIVAEPDEMLHRLVYADWLEEHGSTLDAARADLIRTQLARESAAPDGDEFWQLRARERAILSGRARRLVPAFLPRQAGARFHRGFVRSLEMDADLLDRLHPQIVAAIPEARVRVRGQPTPASVRGLDGLEVLSPGEPTAEEARRLAGAGRWSRLVVGVGWWPLLTAALDRGHPLRHLGIEPQSDPMHSSAGLASETQKQELFDRPCPTGLRALNLAGFGPPDDHLHRLFRWLQGTRLETLELGPSEDDPLGELTRQPFAHTIRRLRVRGRTMRESPPRGPYLAGLRHLRLRRVAAEHADFFGGLGATGLRSLRIDQVARYSDHGEFLKQIPRLWPNLRDLTLGDMRPSVVALPVAMQLRRLAIGSLPVGELGALDPLPLSELRVATADGETLAAFLRGASAFRNLRTFHIDWFDPGTPVDLAPLFDRDRFPYLTHVRLGQNAPTPEIRRHMVARFGAVQANDPEEWLED